MKIIIKNTFFLSTYHIASRAGDLWKYWSSLTIFIPHFGPNKCFCVIKFENVTMHNKKAIKKTMNLKKIQKNCCCHTRFSRSFLVRIRILSLLGIRIQLKFIGIQFELEFVRDQTVVEYYRIQLIFAKDLDPTNGSSRSFFRDPDLAGFY